jgi:hypothetical protein
MATVPFGPGRGDPAGEPHVRQADDVIGMHVRDEMRIDRAERDALLEQTHGRAAAEIEQQFLPAGLDQGGGAERAEPRRGRARAEQGDFERLRRRRAERCAKTDRRESTQGDHRFLHLSFL